MIDQIRVNLDCNLQTHWNLMEEIDAVLEGRRYQDVAELTGEIDRLERLFRTDLYGCRLLLIDTIGTAYLDDGDAGIWDDIRRLADGESRHTFVSDTSNVDGTFLAFAQKLAEPLELAETGRQFTHVVLLKEIETLRHYYTTASYGGKASTYIIKSNGTLAYYDSQETDVIGVRNVFKALREAEYVCGRSFDEILRRWISRALPPQTSFWTERSITTA